MKKILFLLGLFLVTTTAFSQLLSRTPFFATEDTRSFAITVDGGKGNRELSGYSSLTDVYVHIGAITTKSNSASDWKYVKFTWGTANAQARATYAGNSKWTYTLSGSVREFFGITDPNEHIVKIAILFRNGSGSRVQRNEDLSDMYVPLFTSELAVRIKEPFYQPTYVPVPEKINKRQGDEITITAQSNTAALLRILYNGTAIKTEANATSINVSTTISTAGNQVFVAEAFDGSGTTYDTVKFYAESSVNIAPLPAGVRQGVNYGADKTSATLVLYAPGKSRIALIGEFPGSNWEEQAQYQLNKTPDGNLWWIALHNLTPSQEYAYQFLIDGSLRIADPYSEKVLDPAHDPYIDSETYPGLPSYPQGKTTGIVSLLQTEATKYNWKNNTFDRPDKRSLIIYELLVRDFVDKHNWKTLTDSLNYFKRLGINAIELMPFNEFEGNESWGYNPNFFFAPDKYYGTANALKEFIDSCHSNGIAVIMDMVLNHAFGSSPMVQMYWDAQNNRPAADNPWFNPAAKHAFNVGYDFNHESAATKYFVSRVAEHWLQNYKIDGFRWDLSKGFTQKQTCDNLGENCDVGGWSAYDAARVAIWKAYYDTMQLKSPGSYSILEHFADNREEKELSDYGMLLWGNANYSFNEATMGYVSNSDFSPGFASARGWNNPYLVTYMESHDEERLMYKNLQYGNSAGTYNVKNMPTALERQQMAAAFFLAIPGPKMIWQFGELGYDYSINYCEDGSINNDCRLGNKPVRWDYLANENRKKLFDVYSKMNRLRQDPAYAPAFISNSSEHSLAGSVKWIKLNSTSGKVVVIGNFDVVEKSAALAFPTAGEWFNYLSGTSFTATGNTQNFTLKQGEFYVYINSRAALPVTITGFSGKPTPQGNELTWQVSNEEKLMYYIVEKSEDGQNFQELQRLEASGIGQYRFLDASTSAANTIYYRLKMEDVDGKFSYSNIISIKSTNEVWKVWVRPNPFKGELVLNYLAPSEEKVTISVSDLQGRKILSITRVIAEGAGKISFAETRKLAQGTYFVSVKKGGKLQTVKVIKSN